MRSPAQRRETYATQSSERTCWTTRTITASHSRGGNFDTTSTSPGHGWWRSASLHGRRGSVSALECQFLSCSSSQAVRTEAGPASKATISYLLSSALESGTSSTRIVIKSRPASSSRSARKHDHETILDALEQICHNLGLSTQSHNIPSAQKSIGKIGRGDLISSGTTSVTISM